MSDEQDSSKQKESNANRPMARQPQFIPKITKRKVTIRLMDGRPIVGEIVAYNNFELLVDIGNGKKMIVFKHAISTLEYEE